MYLFIFESIGTSELLLIGIVALIFLGPRKMPEMARKIAKMMAEFKSATSEFKETWQKEVNFEEEAKAFDLDAIEAEPVARVESISAPETPETDAPAIKSIDPASFDPKLLTDPANGEASETPKETTVPDHQKDKQNWL
ncbi:MAG TPA: Sec-independent protein translocase protein TatB [Pyrinomonadaceae bacterium]|nr:Sec-independent protein translocase protein TatB [Pyrinomonadaceae bacterium]